MPRPPRERDSCVVKMSMSSDGFMRFPLRAKIRFTVYLGRAGLLECGQRVAEGGDVCGDVSAAMRRGLGGSGGEMRGTHWSTPARVSVPSPCEMR